MNRAQQDRRIVHLVRALVGLGLLMVGITIGLIGWTLTRVRTERALATAEQERLTIASDALRQRAFECRSEIWILLDETIPRTNSLRAVPDFITFIANQSDQRRHTAVGPAIDKFVEHTILLTILTEGAEEWRRDFDPIWQDVSQQRTLGRVRALIMQLRSAVEALEGRRRLDDAIKHRRWRTTTNDASHQLARVILEEQGRVQSQGVNDFKGELAECARLVELLGGEAQIDSLADLKDNKLKPVLDRLGRNIAAFGVASTNAGVLTPQSIEQLKAAIFGTQAAGGGLFTLRHDLLRLRHDREKMKIELAALFHDIETANAGFAQSAQARTATLTQQMEGSLAAGWQRMLYVGGGCSALFLWLAWMISRGIHGQVQAIDHARAEAESGRQTTQRLMLEQQAATTELAAAHKGLEAEVAERQRSEETLSKANQRFEVVTRATTDVIWDWNLQSNAVWWNENFQTVFGYTPSEIGADAESWISRLHPDEKSRIMESLHEVIHGGGNLWLCEYRFRRCDGIYAFIFDRGYVLRNEQGKPVRMIGAMQDFTKRKQSEAELERTHRELQDVSRQAGMAEVATSVLHNVGNVLNSVNVSANYVSDQVRKTPVADLGRVVALLREQGANLGAFFTSDPRGPKVPDFLSQLADKFTRQQEKQLQEIAALQKNIEHIKEIVAMQQSFAKVSGLNENLSTVELIGDAVRMYVGSFQKHEIELVQELAADLPSVCVDKHKVLQILVNLLRNAKHACEDAGREDKRITVRASHENNRVRITIIDNGVGIPPDNLTRIFNHGFTTKKDGHGFGLHSAANAAKEMGGGLTVHSDGIGKGATFILELPVATAQRKEAA